MKNNFNKGLILTSLGSFWWGFIGVIYFESVSFIGHTELVVHRCLWTAFMLIITTTFLSKWQMFLKEIKDKKKLIASYHPSPRNVNTGRINIIKFTKLFKKIIMLVS